MLKGLFFLLFSLLIVTSLTVQTMPSIEQKQQKSDQTVSIDLFTEQIQTKNTVKSCTNNQQSNCQYYQKKDDYQEYQIWQDRVAQADLSIVISEQQQLSSNANLKQLLENNKQWAKKQVQMNPQFFTALVEIQTPKYLWIGCADSRVPANQILNLKPGQLFVHRNVANIVLPSDINALAVIQYAVQFLKVTDIIVTGHYGCGGIKAAFSKQDHGPLQSWLAHLRQLRGRYRKYLDESDQQNLRLLVQLNVKTQVYNIARIPFIQKAWKSKQPLRIHGLVYDLKDGILKDLGINIHRIQQLPKEYRIIQ